VIFADTVFLTKETYAQIIEESKDLSYDKHVGRLNSKYYPITDVIYSTLKQLDLKQINVNK